MNYPDQIPFHTNHYLNNQDAKFINKAEIVQAIWGEKAVYGNQPLMPASPFKANVPDLKRDTKKTKQLLREAGFLDGIDVVLMSSSGYWQYVIATEVIMEQLKEIGFRITLEMSDWPTYAGKCFKGVYTPILPMSFNSIGGIGAHISG